MKKSFNIQELLHYKSKHHGTEPMHPSSLRAFQRHQEHNLKHPGLVDFITTKQNKLPSFIDRLFQLVNILFKLKMASDFFCSFHVIRVHLIRRLEVRSLHCAHCGFQSPKFRPIKSYSFNETLFNVHNYGNPTIVQEFTFKQVRNSFS